MFESIAVVPPGLPRRRPALVAAALCHLALAVGLVLADAWRVEALEPPLRRPTFTAPQGVPVVLGPPESVRPQARTTTLRPARARGGEIRQPVALRQTPLASETVATPSSATTDPGAASVNESHLPRGGEPWGNAGPDAATSGPHPDSDPGPDLATVYAADAVDARPARAADCADPRFPQAALTLRVQGDVELSAIINEEGFVEQIEVLSGPPMLARAASEAARRCRYTPAKLRGRSVRSHLSWKVHFRLQ